jgi:hypothetical protein
VLFGLITFEKIKNVGPVAFNVYIALIFSLYIMIILLNTLKIILDKGFLWLSASAGLIIFCYIMFFTTVAAGFYFYAINNKTENYSYPTIVTSSNTFLTYSLSYSLIGAHYLFELPETSETPNNMPASGKNLTTRLNHIPYQEYIAFFLGLLINVVALAFFVSYAGSIYILRVTDPDAHAKLIQQHSFTNDYITFLSSRLR